jgi:hypothetical protein
MDKKSSQLGMNISTAQGRLDKEILFALVKECKRDICYRCGRKIERAEDLSIDHKVAWLDKDPALFWDVKNNIAFSHKRCNYAAARHLRPSDEVIGNFRNHVTSETCRKGGLTAGATNVKHMRKFLSPKMLRKAAHTTNHVNRGIKKAGCEFC